MTPIRFLVFASFILLWISCKPSAMVPDSSPQIQGEQRITDGDSPQGDAALQNLIWEKEFLLQRYQATRERRFDLLHTSLDLRFDYSNQLVKGEALLTLTPYFYDQEEIVLDAKDFDIHEIWLVEEEERRPLDFEYDERVATISLPKWNSAQDTLQVGMRYTAKPNVNSGSGSRAIADNKGLYFVNPTGEVEGKPVQIWTQGETEHNSKWFPTIDSPNERMTHDIRLTVEEKYLTISNGHLRSQQSNGDGTRTDHWEMRLPHAPYLTAIVVGEFAVVRDSLGTLPLRYIVEEKYKEGAKKVFENTPEMIAFFSELLEVPFPWNKYDQIVVRDFVSGAMENTTASIFMEALNLDERESIDSEWDYIIAHEIFHQWFGNYVTLESWSHLPLNEAFADYSEFLWMEHKEGKDEANMHHIIALESYLAEAQEKQVHMIRFYYEDNEDMFDRHSYAKGGRVLHMLRRHLGDDAFFASLHHYLEQHAFSSVEIHDLRLAFEKITGKDLNWFFDQWFLSAGHPVLDIRFDMSQPDNILFTVSQKQDLSTTPLYKLPFDVAWYQNGERKEAKFVLEQAVQQFALDNGPGTDLVVFDESKVLLAEKNTYLGKAHYIMQASLSEEGIARYEALDSLSNNYLFDEEIAELFLEALEDGFSSIRQLALAKLRAHLGSFPVSQVVEDKILELAEGDPENSVRAAAVELLADIGEDKYSPLFFRLVNDPSYYVAGAALTAYLENPRNSGREEMADRFEGQDNIRMVVPLADFFTSERKVEKQEWFDVKLADLDGENLYYFLGYYGDYYSRVEVTDKTRAMERLSEIGIEHPLGYVRLAAFQSLFGFIDEEGFWPRVRHIYEQEADVAIKSYMEMYLDQPVE